VQAERRKACFYAEAKPVLAAGFLKTGCKGTIFYEVKEVKVVKRS